MSVKIISNNDKEKLIKLKIPEKYKSGKFIIKINITKNEYIIHKLLYNLQNPFINVPRIYYYDKKNSIIVMQKIPELCIADLYGENYDDLPVIIKNELYNVISLMYYNNFEYPDITGYNFIYYRKKIWILDFEHASYNINNHKKTTFMNDFVKGIVNGWNPEFL
jgi:tRNA A-37 threonylcarbamoyl transferase component Bud32